MVCLKTEDLDSAHIVPVTMASDSRLLASLGMNALGQVFNYITLCKSCHGCFDRYTMGLRPLNDPNTYEVVCSSKIRAIPAEFRNKVVVFHRGHYELPSIHAMTWKWQKFLDNLSPLERQKYLPPSN